MFTTVCYHYCLCSVNNLLLLVCEYNLSFISFELALRLEAMHDNVSVADKRNALHLVVGPKDVLFQLCHHVV